MKKILSLAFFILSALSVSAQGGSALLIPTDSRALAMGSTELQPSADKLEANVFYGMWAPKTVDNKIIGLNAFYRLSDKLAFSLEGRKLSDKPYEITNDQGVATGTFSPSDLILGLGASYAINEQLSVSVKAKILSSTLAADIKGSAFCADLRAGYSTDLFSAGLSLRNLGSKIDYGAGGYALPAMVALDGSTSPIDGLTVAAEADYLFSGALMAGLGAEYNVIDMVSVRGGFHYGDAAKALPTFVSLGLGAHFAGASLDLTYLLASKSLGNTLLIGLGYSF